MEIIRKYLDDVLENKKQPNLQILYNLQEIFNCLPNMNTEDMVRSLTIKNNDNTFTLYVCSIIRAITGLHNLINNKIHNRELEKGLQNDKEKEKEKEEKEKGKEKEKEKEKEGAKKADK